MKLKLKAALIPNLANIINTGIRFTSFQNAIKRIEPSADNQNIDILAILAPT